MDASAAQEAAIHDSDVSCEHFKCVIEDAQSVLHEDTISIEYVMNVMWWSTESSAPIDKAVDNRSPPGEFSKRMLLKKYDDFKKLEAELIAHETTRSPSKLIPSDVFVYGSQLVSTNLNPNSAFITMRKDHLQQFCEDVAADYSKYDEICRDIIDQFFELKVLRTDFEEQHRSSVESSSGFGVPKCDWSYLPVWCSLDGCLHWA